MTGQVGALNQNFADRIHSASERKVINLKPRSGSEISFSDAMNALFSGAGQSQKVQKNNISSDRDFSAASSDNLKVREFAVLENRPTQSDFKLLEQNPAAESDFSVLDALSDGLMFASKIAGAVLPFV